MGRALQLRHFFKKNLAETSTIYPGQEAHSVVDSNHTTKGKRKNMMLSQTLRLFLFASASVYASAFTATNFPNQWTTTTRHSQEILLRSAVADTTEESSPAKESGTLSLFSPCKINLFLRIIRKREDGFHDLASLFQAIGFGDTLELTKLPADAVADEFTCNMPGVPVDSSNLVLRALQLMREKTGVEQYFQANLVKQVPAQAGLGGGSANAATAMWGANQLMGNPASLEEVRVEYYGSMVRFDLFGYAFVFS